jgi:hypothetical protein
MPITTRPSADPSSELLRRLYPNMDPGGGPLGGADPNPPDDQAGVADKLLADAHTSLDRANSHEYDYINNHPSHPLADQIKQMHPGAYDDMDPGELESRYIKRFGTEPDTFAGGFAKGVGKEFADHPLATEFIGGAAAGIPGIMLGRALSDTGSKAQSNGGSVDTSSPADLVGDVLLHGAGAWAGGKALSAIPKLAGVGDAITQRADKIPWDAAKSKILTTATGKVVGGIGRAAQRVSDFLGRDVSSFLPKTVAGEVVNPDVLEGEVLPPRAPVKELPPATFTGPQTYEPKLLNPAPFRTGEGRIGFPKELPAANPSPEAARLEQHLRALDENIKNGSSFGYGHVMPEPKPTELSDFVSEGSIPSHGSYHVTDTGHGAFIPNDFQFEAGDPDVPGISVGSTGSNPLARLAKAKTAITGTEAPAPVAPAPTPAAGSPDPEDDGYLEFANAIDRTIKSAKPEDFERSNPTGIARSRLNKRDAQWLTRTGPRGRYLGRVTRVK